MNCDFIPYTMSLWLYKWLHVVYTLFWLSDKEADGGNIKCDSHIPTDYDGIIPEPDFTHEKADFVFAFSTVSGIST